MQFHRALVAGADLEAACREATEEVRRQLGPGPLDLVVAFASPRYGVNVDRLPVLLHENLGARTLVGCSGASLVDDRSVLSSRPAIAVLAGRLPGVHVDATALTPADLPSPDAGPESWRALLPASPLPRRGFLVLGEPFHADVRALLAGLDFAFPGLPKVGGIASGSRHPEGHALFCGRSTQRNGTVVLSLAGDVELGTVVAPTCRPFGRRGRVTRSDHNRLLRVDDQSARTFVEEQLRGLSWNEREVAQASPLLLGLAPDPFADGGEEFLVRTILGVDSVGHLVVADPLPVGRGVQMLMRDPAASAQVLRQRLGRATPHTAAAALLFQCLGHDGDDHAAFAALARGVPLVGFHCNGEIGPAGDGTHLHAFTSAFALLRRRGPR
jgi:small ligand-binding sensory domain FIST